MTPQTLVWLSLALAAFAANSVLCRLALLQTTIDPATFSTIRLTSGAITLLLLTLGDRSATPSEGSWLPAAVLTIYAIPFSFAYTSLGAGTGALILFGTVQVTMILASVWSGERPRAGEWAGLAIALFGLVYLVLPGLTAPPLTAALLMSVAGIAWGVYSLLGRKAVNPLALTTGNFVRSIPFALAVSALAFTRMRVDTRGALLAVLSGAVASGLGYVAWYTALRGLTAIRASLVQLAVPVLAAVAGVLFLAEPVSARLIGSAVLVLGGIAFATSTRARQAVVRGRA